MEGKEKKNSNKTINAACKQASRLRSQKNVHSPNVTLTQIPRIGFARLGKGSIPTIEIETKETVCKAIAIAKRTHKGDNNHQDLVCVVCDCYIIGVEHIHLLGKDCIQEN